MTATTSINIFVEAITTNHLWLVFLVTVSYAIIMSWVLIYHWRSFSTDTKTIKLAQVLYITILFALLGGMVFFISIF
ncbi:MAG: hypothetical protein QG609_298 [Patescibacteria group bacterium]|nr:hypothetical protein [Patescibacteria group bacterium]